MATSSSASSRRGRSPTTQSEEHTSELQSQSNLVCRLLLEKKKTNSQIYPATRLSSGWQWPTLISRFYLQELLSPTYSLGPPWHNCPPTQTTRTQFTVSVL